MIPNLSLIYAPGRTRCRRSLHVVRRYATRGQAAIWENQELREWLLAQREQFRQLMKER